MNFPQNIIIIVVLIVGNKVQHSDCWNFEKTKNCAKLTSESNNNRQRLDIEHGSGIVDLSEVYYNYKSGNLNSFKSWGNTSVAFLDISPHCSISVCTQPYFQGNCLPFNSSTAARAVEQNIASLTCNCAENCELLKCPEIKLKKKSDCARMFIEHGCNTCSGMYLDVLKGNKSFFGSFPDRDIRIRSLIVKENCKLWGFDEEEYNGIAQLFQGGVHDKIPATIKSYTCECEDIPISPQLRSPKLPQLISIPENIGLLLSNETFKNHPGLLASIQSMENGKSPKDAYIMVLGMTGAGKSASINFLFGNRPIAEIGEVESVTSEIHEYTFPVHLDDLGIENSKLHVIDTPGLGDTRGLMNDARFLATLENYFKNHIELKSRTPNLVLVFAKFTENRFSGEAANFVKMLKSLDLLSKRLFTKDFSNVVFVLSHYMSDSKSTTKNPKSQIDEFKKVIEKYTLFPKPIMVTVAENRPEDEELPMVNGYYQLPSGELYPKNILDKIFQVTTDDPIGRAIIKCALEEPEELKFSKTIIPLLNISESSAQRFLGTLTAANFKVEETQVSSILSEVWGNDTLTTPQIKSQYPDTLPYTQLVLNVRNIFTLENVPKSRVEIVRLLKHIRKTPAIISLLEKGLNLKAPPLQGPFFVGSSYDLQNDNVLSVSPVDLTKLQISDTGYSIPDTFSCKESKEFSSISKVFDLKQAYYEDRLSNMGVKTVNSKTFTGVVKPGYTVKNEGDVSVIHEIRLFTFQLNEKFELSKQFTDDLKALPSFTTHNQATVDKYNDFFKKYGTHVVQSAFGGGSLEITSKMDASLANTKLEDITKKLKELGEDLTLGKIPRTPTNLNYTIKLQGGGSNFKTVDMKSLAFRERLTTMIEWVESLNYEPVMLPSSIKLTPLDQIAKMVGPAAQIQLSKALNILLSSPLGISYTPDPEILRLQREREAEIARKAAAKLVEENRLKAEAAEKVRIEAEKKKEEELKKRLEEKRLELERIQKELEAERKRQHDALVEMQKKQEAEALRKREAEAKERKRIEEEQRKERERLAEVQRLEAVRRQAERERIEAAKAEAQRKELERIQRDIAAQRQRQLEVEQALQRRLEAERLAAKVAADEAAAQAALAAASSSCKSGRGKRSADTLSHPSFSKYAILSSRVSNVELKVISMDEVSHHANSDDFWVILFDRVYDVTPYLARHPGGKVVMMEYAGDDATFAFQSAGHGKMEMLEPYLIGILPPEDRLFMKNYVLSL